MVIDDLPLTAYVYFTIPLVAYLLTVHSILFRKIAADSIHFTADSISKQFETIGKDLNHLDIFRRQILRKLSYLVDNVLFSINFPGFLIWFFGFDVFRFWRCDFEFWIAAVNLDIDRPPPLNLAIFEIAQILESF